MVFSSNTNNSYNTDSYNSYGKTTNEINKNESKSKKTDLQKKERNDSKVNEYLSNNKEKLKASTSPSDHDSKAGNKSFFKLPKALSKLGAKIKISSDNTGNQTNVKESPLKESHNTTQTKDQKKQNIKNENLSTSLENQINQEKIKSHLDSKETLSSLTTNRNVKNSEHSITENKKFIPNSILKTTKENAVIDDDWKVDKFVSFSDTKDVIKYRKEFTTSFINQLTKFIMNKLKSRITVEILKDVCQNYHQLPQEEKEKFLEGFKKLENKVESEKFINGLQLKNEELTKFIDNLSSQEKDKFIQSLPKDKQKEISKILKGIITAKDSILLKNAISSNLEKALTSINNNPGSKNKAVEIFKDNLISDLFGPYQIKTNQTNQTNQLIRDKIEIEISAFEDLTKLNKDKITSFIQNSTSFKNFLAANKLTEKPIDECIILYMNEKNTSFIDFINQNVNIVGFNYNDIKEVLIKIIKNADKNETVRVAQTNLNRTHERKILNTLNDVLNDPAETSFIKTLFE